MSINKDKLSIKVKIVDRSYPMKIKMSDEENIRKAVDLINEKVLLYKKSFRDKDDQDFLAMASLQVVTELLNSANSNDISPIVENIKKIDQELGKFIENL